MPGVQAETLQQRRLRLLVLLQQHVRQPLRARLKLSVNHSCKQGVDITLRYHESCVRNVATTQCLRDLLVSGCNQVYKQVRSAFVQPYVMMLFCRDGGPLSLEIPQNRGSLHL